MTFSLAHFIAAYCAGTFPTGYFIARLRGVKNITDHGSGSMGATNVARILGKPYFFIVLFLDGLKAYAFMYYMISLSLPLPYQFISAAFFLLGNSYSIFLQGRGGKGVASTIGILAAYAPLLLPGLCLVWFFVLALTRTVGIASVITLSVLPLCAIFYNPLYEFIVFFAGLALWSIWRHKTNIITYYQKNLRVKKGRYEL